MQSAWPPTRERTDPVHLTELDRGRAGATFDQMAQSIAGYEASAEVTPFTSKFDAVLAGKAQFTPREQAGYALFRALVSFMQTLTALVSERHGCDIDRAATSTGRRSMLRLRQPTMARAP